MSKTYPQCQSGPLRRSSLPTEVRLEVLRFTDSTVVQRVHDYMIKLLKAETLLNIISMKPHYF